MPEYRSDCWPILILCCFFCFSDNNETVGKLQLWSPQLPAVCWNRRVSHPWQVRITASACIATQTPEPSAVIYIATPNSTFNIRDFLGLLFAKGLLTSAVAHLFTHQTHTPLALGRCMGSVCANSFYLSNAYFVAQQEHPHNCKETLEYWAFIATASNLAEVSLMQENSCLAWYHQTRRGCIRGVAGSEITDS